MRNLSFLACQGSIAGSRLKDATRSFPPLFKPNTRILFGDAKASLQALVAEFKGT